MADLLDDEFKKEAEEAGSLKDTLQNRQEDREKAELEQATKENEEPQPKEEENAEEKQEADDFGIPADDSDEIEEEEGEEKEQDPEKAEPESAEDPDPQSNKQNARRRINKKVLSLNERLQEEQNKNIKLEREKKEAEEEIAAHKALEEPASKDEPKSRLPDKPKAEDFDLEDEDSEYLKKKTAYDNAVIEQKVEEKFNKVLGSLQKNKIDSVKQNRQEDHYRRVEESGNKNYDKEEETVIKVLGAKNVSDIINLFPKDSDIIIKNLAYDRESMDETLEAVKEGNTIELIRLMERASNKQKGKTRKVLTPDRDDLRGSQNSSGESNKYDLEGSTFT